MPVFKNEGQRHLVCNGEICELERRTQAEMQAGFRHKRKKRRNGSECFSYKIRRLTLI